MLVVVLETLHLPRLQLAQILAANMYPSAQVAHLVYFQILALLAQTRLDVLLFELWALHGLLEHLLVCGLVSTHHEIQRGAHRGKLDTRDFGTRGEKAGGECADVDFWEGGSVVGGAVERGRCRRAGYADDVFQARQADFVDLFAVEKGHEHGFELYEARVRAEQFRGEV